MAINAVIINNETLSNFTIGSDYKFLFPIKKWNIFIGANNSGKSRFVRELFKQLSERDIIFYNQFFLNINNVDDLQHQISTELIRIKNTYRPRNNFTNHHDFFELYTFLCDSYKKDN